MTTTTHTAAQTIAATIAAGIKPAPFGAVIGGFAGYFANHAKTGRIRLGRPGYGVDQTECCAYCGKLAIGARFAAYLTDGSSFAEVAEAPNEDVGFYPLGSDCARRLRGVVPVYTINGERV